MFTRREAQLLGCLKAVAYFPLLRLSLYRKD